MNLIYFLWGSLPLFIQFYADMYRETDYKNTLLELESEHNVPIVKTYDFIVGKLHFFCHYWIVMYVINRGLQNF